MRKITFRKLSNKDTRQSFSTTGKVVRQQWSYSNIRYGNTTYIMCINSIVFLCKFCGLEGRVLRIHVKGIRKPVACITYQQMFFKFPLPFFCCSNSIWI